MRLHVLGLTLLAVGFLTPAVLEGSQLTAGMKQVGLHA